MGLEVTCCIVTRNRASDACRAVASVLKQDAELELLVVNDASEDETGDALRARFPALRIHAFSKQQGYIVCRNWCLRNAASPVIIFLDDDAYLPDSSTVRRTLDDFCHPRIGAVAIPFLENGVLMQGAPGGEGITLCRSFIGAAHAMRKDVAARVGYYRESLGFYCEESDYCLRMLDAGYVVREGTASPAVHVPNPDRVQSRRLAQRWANELRIKWYNTPASYLPLVLPHHVVNASITALRTGYPAALIRGLFRAAAILAMSGRERDPVSVDTFRLWQQIARTPGIELSAIEDRLRDIGAEPGIEAASAAMADH